MTILTINGLDFTPWISSGGIKWSRNDLDHSSSGRTLDGVMHRKRTAIKVKLSVNLKRINNEELTTINNALLPETVSATYVDPIYGNITKTFYGSKVSATTLMVVGDQLLWDDTQFDLTEV